MLGISLKRFSPREWSFLIKVIVFKSTLCLIKWKGDRRETYLSEEMFRRFLEFGFGKGRNLARLG